jgi:UDP-N-acetylmuramoyl-L-alanyl-D-glutamate--2,6-diaminopimelate ligase
MELIKRFIPKFILKLIRPFYHGLVAWCANIYFGFPSKKLIVIGITGTGGKSSTTTILREILNKSGKPCGSITTISFFNGREEFINKHGLSMPGGWLLQKNLKEMLNNGCQYAVVECTSEGLFQNRHLGIKFDSVVFTNISEAHIQAHGNFDNYKKAKGKLFQALSANGLGLSVVNLDDLYSKYFLEFSSKKKIGLTFNNASSPQCEVVYSAEKTVEGFSLNGYHFQMHLFGEFNKVNGCLAVVVAKELGVDWVLAQNAVDGIKAMRGRMELVPNNRQLTLLVDYGCEPATFLVALKAVAEAPHNKLIHVFGSTGGHRDVSKRFIFGQTSAKYADYIIITNDDIYDSDPQAIARNIESGVKSQELWQGKYEIILDRRLAIRRALSIAEPGDTVLFTGKSSEQFLVLPGNKRIEWDEVEVVKAELIKLNTIK